MKIHEYQAKELLAAAGASVPRGIVVTSPGEAVKAFDQLGGPVVLKAQIHAGGRGKGRFKDSGSDFGGVKFIKSRDEVAKVAEVMFKYPLVTKQTGLEGQKVSKVLVQEAADIAREIYVGVVVDRAIGMPVLMACAEGGVEIEEVAARSPEKILKVPVAPEVGLQPFQARRLAYELGFTPEQAPKAEAIMIALARVFLDKDCSLAEINPLVVTPKGDVIVLDAKMTFDDNALFRHPDIEKLLDESEENPADLRAAKAGLTYISLNGNIGCLVNGAGLAMSTMDIIKHHGGEPANFLDVGGGVTADGAIEAFRIILSDAKVKGVLVNIFGGIAKCDLIAEALVKAGREVGFKVPVVVRLEGTNVAKAREILTAARTELPTMQTATDLTDAAKKGGGGCLIRLSPELHHADSPYFVVEANYEAGVLKPSQPISANRGARLMAIVTTKPITAEEFYEWVQRPENRDKFFELERGEIVEMSRPGKRHGLICGNTVWVLGNYVRQRKRGYVCSNDTGVIVDRDPDTVRGPDIMLFDDAETMEQVEKQFGEKPPLLAVEVLSPNDSMGKILKRVREQLHFGTKLVWVLDPEAREVIVYRPGTDEVVLQENEDLTAEDVLPGFRCKVADFFALPGH